VVIKILVDENMHDITRKRICALLEKKEREKKENLLPGGQDACCSIWLVDFSSPSPDALDSRRPVHAGVKDGYSCKKWLFISAQISCSSILGIWK